MTAAIVSDSPSAVSAVRFSGPALLWWSALDESTAARIVAAAKRHLTKYGTPATVVYLREADDDGTRAPGIEVKHGTLAEGMMYLIGEVEA